MNKTDVYMNPGIVVTESGTYIVAGVWIKVPEGTTRKDIPNYVTRKNYESSTPKKESEKVIENKVHQVEGSNGTIYDVKLNGSYWSCTCPGFGFNRRCKHIDSVTGANTSESTPKKREAVVAGKKIEITKLY